MNELLLENTSERKGGGDLVSRDPFTVESRSWVCGLLGFLLLLLVAAFQLPLPPRLLDRLGYDLVLDKRLIGTLLLEVGSIVGRAMEVGLRELGEPFVASLSTRVSFSKGVTMNG